MAKSREIVALFLSPKARGPMQSVESVRAIRGRGLEGDRYGSPEGGSFNQGKPGTRQVTAMSVASFEGTIFELSESRRNIITQGIEINRLLGRSDKHRAGELEIGNNDVVLRAVKYCFPCDIPDQLSGKPGFKFAFYERGGVIFEVLKGGIIRVGAKITPYYT